MTHPSLDGRDVLARLTEARGNGASADGLVHVETDGTGDITRLRIEPAAMRMPAEDLAGAVVEAFQAARAEVRDSVQREIAAEAETATPPDAAYLLGGIERGAMRRLDELTDMAQRLADRLSRPGF